jgi:hypothetical protein
MLQLCQSGGYLFPEEVVYLPIGDQDNLSEVVNSFQKCADGLTLVHCAVFYPGFFSGEAATLAVVEDSIFGALDLCQSCGIDRIQILVYPIKYLV